MNLLFTSAGRRDYLISYFASEVGPSDVIHVGNSDPICSAFTTATRHVCTPPIHSDEYIPFLLNYCRGESINAIIPLFDIDLPVLASARKQFEEIGTAVVVSSPEVIATCNDKWQTAQFLNSVGINTPATFLEPSDALAALRAGKIQFPLVVKPRWGMGSIAVMEATTEEELKVFTDFTRRRIFSSYLKFESKTDPDRCVIIQQKVTGQEFGLDVLNDLRGHCAAVSVKRKIAMRAGETDAAVTEIHPRLHATGQKLGATLQHRGNLDVDVLYDGKNVVVLELNCRFGGGYPFTHLAGGNFVAALLAWLRGEQPREAWLRAKPGIMSLKSILPVILS